MSNTGVGIVAAVNLDPRAIPKINAQLGFVRQFGDERPAVGFQHFPSNVFSSGVCRGDVGEAAALKALPGWRVLDCLTDQIANGGDSLAASPMRELFARDIFHLEQP